MQYSDLHAQLLGSLFNWALYGALAVQICIDCFFFFWSAIPLTYV